MSVLDVLNDHSMRLHSVANATTRSDLVTPMRRAAEDFTQATRRIEAAFDAACRVCANTGHVAELRDELKNCGLWP